MYNGFLINLDRRENRLQQANEVLDKTGIHIERVSAVDGAEIEITDQLKARINPWNLNKRNIPNPKKLGGILGCCLSHLSVWEKISSMTDEYVFVFEDDVAFYHKDFNFAENWKDIEMFLPEDFGLLWLNAKTFTRPSGNPYSKNNRMIPTNETRTTEAYIVTPQFAKQLYDDITNNLGAVDAHMSQFCNKLCNSDNSKNKKFYKLENPFFCQRSADTDIQFH